MGALGVVQEQGAGRMEIASNTLQIHDEVEGLPGVSRRANRIAFGSISFLVFGIVTILIGTYFLTPLT
jgi:hypothetical protein